MNSLLYLNKLRTILLSMSQFSAMSTNNDSTSVRGMIPRWRQQALVVGIYHPFFKTGATERSVGSIAFEVGRDRVKILDQIKNVPSLFAQKGLSAASVIQILVNINGNVPAALARVCSFLFFLFLLLGCNQNRRLLRSGSSGLRGRKVRVDDALTGTPGPSTATALFLPFGCCGDEGSRCCPRGDATIVIAQRINGRHSSDGCIRYILRTGVVEFQSTLRSCHRFLVFLVVSRHGLSLIPSTVVLVWNKHWGC
mmetsp:Transcript_119137/g.243601  ORF Transcript_119137/g.243601 Transcript_119137/m.243601 type:complete len:253 (-) Transcript_119137:101-859(-)